jgi:hypothetical protein
VVQGSPRPRSPVRFVHGPAWSPEAEVTIIGRERLRGRTAQWVEVPDDSGSLLQGSSNPRKHDPGEQGRADWNLDLRRRSRVLLRERPGSSSGRRRRQGRAPVPGTGALLDART